MVEVTLKSSDGEEFVIDEAVAVESQTIKHVIEGVCPDGGIPIPNVTSKVLSMVIEYCKKHIEAAAGRNLEDRAATAEDDLKSWDAYFVKVDQATLFDLILAANYLEIKSLLDLTCQTVADMMEGKTPDEILRMFIDTNIDVLHLCLKAANYQDPSVKSLLDMISQVTLRSSDGEQFPIDVAVALKSRTIRHMIEDGFTDIPVPNVTSNILSMVIQYCKKHAKAEAVGNPKDDLKLWDANFVKVDQTTLFDLILAANYLNIKSLLDLTCQTVADMIKGKTPAEICRVFNINTEFTPEEEEEVRRENQWAFE